MAELRVSVLLLEQILEVKGLVLYDDTYSSALEDFSLN